MQDRESPDLYIEVDCQIGTKLFLKEEMVDDARPAAEMVFNAAAGMKWNEPSRS